MQTEGYSRRHIDRSGLRIELSPSLEDFAGRIYLAVDSRSRGNLDCVRVQGSCETVRTLSDRIIYNVLLTFPGRLVGSSYTTRGLFYSDLCHFLEDGPLSPSQEITDKLGEVAASLKTRHPLLFERENAIPIISNFELAIPYTPALVR